MKHLYTFIYFICTFLSTFLYKIVKRIPIFEISVKQTPTINCGVYTYRLNIKPYFVHISSNIFSHSRFFFLLFFFITVKPKLVRLILKKRSVLPDIITCQEQHNFTSSKYIDIDNHELEI